MDPKTTGVFISKLRKEQGLTQKQMAEKLNVSDKAVSRWETGKGYPDIETLSALSKEFGISINELLLGERHTEKINSAETERQIADAYINTVNYNKNISQVIKCVLIFFLVFWLIIALAAVAFVAHSYGGYYWFDYSDIPADRDYSGYSDIEAYYLSPSIYPQLDRLFAMNGS